MTNSKPYFEVLVIPKSTYGRMLFYPANKHAELFLTMLGKSTFNEKDLKNLKLMNIGVGYEYPKLP